MRQYPTCVTRHEISCAKLHTVRTHGGSDVRPGSDEHRSLWWTRQRDQPSRAQRQLSTRAARVSSVQGNCGTARRDGGCTDPEIISCQHHSIRECMNSG
jgi:hypothetical protein